MKATDIEWDAGRFSDELPREIRIPDGIVDVEDISDYITNLTGFTHKGFRLIDEDEEMRKVYALICVNDAKAYSGTIDYLEEEFGWLEDSRIFLREAFIADDDESDHWQAYLNYLVDWAFKHQGENPGSSPLFYELWRDTKQKEKC